MHDSSPVGASNIAPLDGMRGLAAMFVVVSHLSVDREKKLRFRQCPITLPAQPVNAT